MVWIESTMTITEEKINYPANPSLNYRKNNSGVNTDLLLKQNLPVYIGSVTSDTTFTDIIPANSYLYYIVMKNNGSSSITINAGTTAHGNDLLSGLNIASGTTVPQTILGFINATKSIYFWSSAWGGNSLDIKIKLENVF